MRKRMCGFFLLAAVLILLPALGLAMGDGAVVNNPNPKDRLHLRAAPDGASASLGKYYNGTPVTILDYYVKDGWYKVGIGYAGFVNGRDTYQLEGYMMKQYLTSNFNGASDRVASAMPEYMSPSSAWELYQKPAKNARYTMHGFGEQVRLMGFTDAWWHIAIVRDGDLGETGFVPAQNSLANSYTAVVNNPNPRDRLHLRVSADAGAKSLGKYFNGVKVQVLSFHMDGAWARVRIGTVEGYMMTQYLAMGNDANRVKSAIPTVRVNTSKLNLRETASYAGRILGQYPQGTNVTVWGVGETWLHVTVGGKSGYMVASLLTPLPGEGGPTPTVPVGGRKATLTTNTTLRDTASLSGNVLALLGSGTQVTIQGQSGDWYRVRIGITEAYGWLLKSTVRID